jgi:hypothetical protein
MSTLSDSSTPPTQTDIPKGTEEEDYFDLPAARKAVTAPATPTGRPRRGISFDTRLEVHETWHSAEYDRRGEPATCNRLTAQLAQMIKEELNAFKMQEMVVHEVRQFLFGANGGRIVGFIPTSFEGLLHFVDLVVRAYGLAS